MKPCAYCKELCTPTKEHVWPAGILRQKGAPDLALAPGAERYFKGEPQVNDVCTKCNSERLTVLDTYLISSYEEQFSKKIGFREDTTFNYKYDLLLRSLLKVSYNSHRANNDKRQIELFEFIRSYILSGSNRPRSEVRLQIVTESKTLSKDTESFTYTPNQLRSVMLESVSEKPNGIITRIVILNSFWFFIVVDAGNGSKRAFKEAISKLVTAKSPSGITLNRYSNQITIPWNKTTWMDPEMWGNNNMLTAKMPNK